MSTKNAWRVINYDNDNFMKQWLESEKLYSRFLTSFIPDAMKKADELGGKLVMIHDEVIIDLPVEKLHEFSDWAKERPEGKRFLSCL